MKHHTVCFAVVLTFTSFLASAREQILFVSGRHGNDEIYRQFPGGRTQRLTFDEGRDLHPALSPDGTKMAYVSTIDKVFEIAVLDFKSGKSQQLTFSPKSNFHPTWSPDGSRIAFSSERDGDFDIFVMDSTGKNVTKMTDNFPWDDSWPHWSPTSQKVVFTSNRDGGAEQIYLLDVQTGIQQKLTTSSFRAAYPKWSPNESQIAYLSARRSKVPRNTMAIWRAKADGTNLEALVTEGEHNTDPKFSHDGKWLAFVSYRDRNQDIFALNLETQELKRLTTHPGEDSYPDWSSDGERIVFASNREGIPDFDIYMMSVNREQLTNLTKSGMVEFNPAWSPDGGKIAFSRVMRDKSIRIYVMDTNGKNEVLLVDLPFANFSPAWSPQGDKLAFVNYPERGNAKFQICVVDLDGKHLRVLNENLDGQIGEIVWSHDGRQILFSQIDGRIAFFDTETHEVHTIDVPVENVFNLDLSPNGEASIFSGIKKSEKLEPRYGVFIIDRDGNPLRTILMGTVPSSTDGLAWSPDGSKILVGRDGGFHTLDLDTESIELFMESASEPDWQDPSLPRSVSPRDKLATTWGDMKKAEKL